MQQSVSVSKSYLQVNNNRLVHSQHTASWNFFFQLFLHSVMKWILRRAEFVVQQTWELKYFRVLALQILRFLSNWKISLQFHWSLEIIQKMISKTNQLIFREPLCRNRVDCVAYRPKFENLKEMILKWPRIHFISKDRGGS